MTDSEIPSDITAKMNQLCEMHDIDTNDCLMYHREIGNGPQYAIRLFESDSDSVLWESPWYSESEMEIYLRGMDNIQTMQRKTDN